MKNIGIYTHIPFCVKKCDYCDFVSYGGKDDFIEKYVEVLKKEITYTLEKDNYNINTIYIGGGTPSLIASKYIIEIIDTIRSMAKKYFPSEITIEVNPRYNYRAKIIRLQKCRNKQIKYWTSRNQQFIIKADRKNSYL